LAAQLSDTIRHRVIEDPGQGLKFLLDKSGPRDLILVTGSLYLLGQILPALRDAVDATRAGSNPLHPQA
jgi:folylpolyglutamate synthase/dihydropteroate synthase